ncbi:MAG: rRNA pseudouridine synthase [Spirochaetales bacterium]|nr:rRNA pseudouridine synthase [Spirochaetales bacterium]
MNKTMRLHVYMAHCGIGSRRKCEDYIKEKKVKVNGEIVTTLGFIISHNDIIEFENKRIKPKNEKIYIALNKPVHYLCSSSDKMNRPLAGDLFKAKITTRLFHVGRLDYLSSGLIFYTNDGDFAYKVTHPSFEIEKEYLVKTGNKIYESHLKKYEQGITIDEDVYTLKAFNLLSPYKVNLIIVEGKNREIRRVFKHLDMTVTKIHRIRIGMVQLGSLKPGQYRHLSQKEVDSFF